jgi:hypothetical protein
LRDEGSPVCRGDRKSSASDSHFINPWQSSDDSRGAFKFVEKFHNNDIGTNGSF